MDLKKYKALKREAERLQSEADEAKGALKEVMRSLKKEFGCSSLKEAKKKLRELKNEKDEAEAEFQQLLEKFDADWSMAIESDEGAGEGDE